MNTLKKPWHYQSDTECANCGQPKEYIQSLWASDSETINSINQTSCCIGCSIMNHCMMDDLPQIYYSELSIIMKGNCVKCFQPTSTGHQIAVPSEKNTFKFIACNTCIDELFKFMLVPEMSIGALKLPHNHVPASK